MAINKVILIGNLGKDPEVRHSPTGQAVCNLSIATSESWTDKNGQKQEKTEWHRVVVFSKLAELCGQYLSKGRQAYIEGKLQTRSWQDKDGQTRYTTEVVAQSIQFLGGNAGKSAGNNADYGAPQGAGNNNNSAPSYQDNNPAHGMNPNAFQAEPSFTEEDVPF
jgi:single-strand DNA-binding protein